MPGINKQIIQTQNKILSVTAKNTTGSAISVGKIVYITGSQGSMATIALSDKDMEATSSKTFGLVAKNVADNGTVDIITKGKYKFNGLDTTALTEGTALWLGDDGNLLQSPPAEPAHAVFIGYLEIKGTNSTIIVDIQNGYELNELHGVQIANEQDGQALVYETSTGLWKNKYSWEHLANNAKTNGTEIAITGGTYLVYTINGNTIYRFLSTALDANGYNVEDSFYATLTSGTLSNLIVTRG